MTGNLPTIVAAIVTAARDAAADIEYASTEENLTPQRASALKALSDNFYATAFQAEDNDPEGVRTRAARNRTLRGHFKTTLSALESR